MVTSLMIRQCVVFIGGYEMPVDLVFLELRDFDVILGMDWLATCDAPPRWDPQPRYCYHTAWGLPLT